jgi:MoaA/NifB/PqqE/SkfB family radical SAM enzyme
MKDQHKHLDLSDINMPDGIPKIAFFKNYNDFEVSCCLHTLCNLSCRFCFETECGGERGVRKVNLDYIKTLPAKVVEAAVPQMKKHGYKVLRLGIWGGELLADSLPDFIFDVYAEFISDIRQKMKEMAPECEVKVGVLSNGVFTKRERVEAFLDATDSILSFSYDPVDRFSTEEQRKVWFDNYKYFENRLTGVSITLTKNTIDAYIKGDEVYEQLSDVIPVEINYYSPRLDHEEYLTSDDDIFKYYKWCLDTGKFNISGIESILQCRIKETAPMIEKVCSCKSCYSFSEEFENDYGKSYISNCIDLTPFPLEDFYGEYADKVDDQNCSDVKSTMGMMKRGCLSCKYYDYCQMMCWTLLLFKEYQMTTCPLKKIYEYIEENPQILVNYLEWREKE